MPAAAVPGVSDSIRLPSPGRNQELAPAGMPLTLSETASGMRLTATIRLCAEAAPAEVTEDGSARSENCCEGCGMVQATATEWLSEPLAPVTVTVALPGCAVPGTR